MSRIFEIVLTMSLWASYGILLVLAARLLLRWAPRRLTYLLWLPVLFRLLCPVSLQSPLSLLPRLPQEAQSGWQGDASMAFFGEPATASPPADSMPQGGTIITGAPGNGATLPQSTGPSWFFYGGILWLAGALALFLWGLWRSLQLRHWLRDAHQASTGIFTAPGLPTAFVLGLLRPRIYLPQGLDAREQALVLAHERSHLARGDHWLRPLCYVALCLHWFNPLCWLAYCLSGRDMEQACDERTLAQLGEPHRLEYASCLLRQSSTAPLPLGFGKHPVGARIGRLLNPRKPALWLLLLTCAAVGVLSLGLMLDPKKPPQPPGTQEILQVDEVLYQSPLLSSVVRPETAPQYWVSDQGILWQKQSLPDSPWQPVGPLEAQTWTKEQFLGAFRLLDPTGEPKIADLADQVAQAYQAGYSQSQGWDLGYFTLKNGDRLLAIYGSGLEPLKEEHPSILRLFSLKTAGESAPDLAQLQAQLIQNFPEQENLKIFALHHLEEDFWVAAFSWDSAANTLGYGLFNGRTYQGGGLVEIPESLGAVVPLVCPGGQPFDLILLNDPSLMAVTPAGGEGETQYPNGAPTSLTFPKLPGQDSIYLFETQDGTLRSSRENIIP